MANLTEKAFIEEWWAYCRGCNIGDTAHTVETERMREFYRALVAPVVLQKDDLETQVAWWREELNGAERALADEMVRMKEVRSLFAQWGVSEITDVAFAALMSEALNSVRR